MFPLLSRLRATDSQLFSFSSSSYPWNSGHFFFAFSLSCTIPVYLSKHFGLAYLFGSSLLVPFSKAVVPSIAHRPTGISHIFVHNVYISRFKSPFPPLIFSIHERKTVAWCLLLVQAFDDYRYRYVSRNRGIVEKEHVEKQDAFESTIWFH